MAIATEITARRYEDVSANIGISVDFPLYEASDIQVIYGKSSLLAVLNVDYQLALSEDFDTFTLTPTSALLDKINALVLGSSSEENYIVIKRVLDYTTEATAAGVRYTPFTSREFERTIMRFQQIQEELDRAFKLAPSFTDTNYDVALPGAPGKALGTAPNGSGLVALDYPFSLTVDGQLSFPTMDAFRDSFVAYETFTNGTSGGDKFIVNGNVWETLPSTDLHLYYQSAGGVKARRQGGVKVVVITGQSNAAGVYSDGPNPASSLVSVYNGSTGALGSSDFTQQPLSLSNPNGNTGNNNIGLGRAHWWADQGYAVVLVFDAVGGTSIDLWVATGVASPRYALLRTKVLASLELAGRSVIDELIWSQGEEDAPDSFEEHFGNLKTLRNQFRAESWCTWATPIYMTGPSNLHDRYFAQNAIQEFCSKVDNRCIFVPSNGLRTNYDPDGITDPSDSGIDWTHFLGESLWELGYVRIAEARPYETIPQMMYTRGGGVANPSSSQVLLTYGSDVGRDSWTSTLPINAASVLSGIVRGFEHALSGITRWSAVFGYRNIANNLRYWILGGRDNTVDDGAEFGVGGGWQNRAKNPYQFFAGRGHELADEGGSAVGLFSKYTAAETDEVIFQVGIGTSSSASGRENGLTVRKSGKVEIPTVAQSSTPTQDGEVIFRKVDGDNSKVEIAFRGTDGTVRSAVLDVT